MFETFKLRKVEQGSIEGYHWKLENPKKVVCIIHGIGEHGGRYDRVATRFNEAGFAVLAMDLRGHGKSLGKQGECAPRADVLDDVSALITCAQLMYPGVPLILYGHSMGGNIALDYRSRGGMNDVPAAYLISAPWIRLVHPIPEPAYWGVRVLSKIMPRFTVGSAVDESALGNPESVKPYTEDPLVHNRISALCAVDGFEVGRKLARGKLEDNGRAAKIPTMLMHGGDDQICDPQATRHLAARLNKLGHMVKHIEWQGLFHEIHNGGGESTGDEVIDRMIEFIQSIGEKTEATETAEASGETEKTVEAEVSETTD